MAFYSPSISVCTSRETRNGFMTALNRKMSEDKILLNYQSLGF
jgi:hypothetical protein